MSNFANCSGGTPAPLGTGETDVFAGQQVNICLVNPAPGGTWTISEGSGNRMITGGFVDGAGTPGTQPSASAGGSEAPLPDLTQNGFTFYFLVPGTSPTATYTWPLANGDTGQTTADFNVIGPTGSVLPIGFADDDIANTSLLNYNSAAASMSMTDSPAMNLLDIVFTDNATLPTGKLIWVQNLNSVTYSQLVVSGSSYTPSNALDQVDGMYPYFNGNPTKTWDSPARPLYSIFGEAAEAFDATMFVLWDPALPTGCTAAWTDTSTKPYYTPHASTCTSTPVPLASLDWDWHACAINAGGGANPSWFIQCGSSSGITTGSASGYPQWSSCYTSSKANCQ